MQAAGPTNNALQAEWEQVQAAQQSPAAFAPLYDRYYEPIFRFVWKRTADEELAGDLTAHIFLKALQKLSSYSFRGLPFSSWLYRIAANEVTQHYRTATRNRVVAIDDSGIQAMAEEGEDWEGLEKNLAALKEAMQRLNEEEILMVEMRFFEQRPFAEIAEILSITENNAKVRMYRLLGKMKKWIKN